MSGTREQHDDVAANDLSITNNTNPHVNNTRQHEQFEEEEYDEGLSMQTRLLNNNSLGSTSGQGEEEYVVEGITTTNPATVSFSPATNPTASNMNITTTNEQQMSTTLPSLDSILVQHLLEQNNNAAMLALGGNISPQQPQNHHHHHHHLRNNRTYYQSSSSRRRNRRAVAALLASSSSSSSSSSKMEPYFLTMNLFRYRLHASMLVLQLIISLIQVLLTRVWTSSLLYTPNWMLHFTTICFPLYLLILFHIIHIFTWYIRQTIKFLKRRRRHGRMSDRRKRRKKIQIYTSICSLLFHTVLFFTIVFSSLKLQYEFNFSDSIVYITWSWIWIFFPMMIYIIIQMSASLVYHIARRSIGFLVLNLAILSNMLLFLSLGSLCLEKKLGDMTPYSYLALATPLFLNLIFLASLALRQFLMQYRHPYGVFQPQLTMAETIRVESGKTMNRLDTGLQLIHVLFWVVILLSCMIAFMTAPITSTGSSGNAYVYEEEVLQLPWEQPKYAIMVIVMCLVQATLVMLWCNIRVWVVSLLYRKLYSSRIAQYFPEEANRSDPIGTGSREATTTTQDNEDDEERALNEMERLTPFAFLYLHSVLNRNQDGDEFDGRDAEALFRFIRQQHGQRPRSSDTGVSRSYVNRLPTFSYVSPAEPITDPQDQQGYYTCSVCLEDFQGGEQLRMLPCFHRFHVDCIDGWLIEKGTCPICRSSAIQLSSNETSALS